MRNITLEELLEAGCHFGHQVARQNPKTRDFIFEARDGIHIIDLEKTKEGLERGAAFIKQVALRSDSSILILGTKRQAELIVKEEVERAYKTGINNLLTVTTRWIGGTFTNFSEVTKNHKKLKDLSEKLKNEFEKVKYTKKEISLWEKERLKLDKYYGGTKDMKKIPDVLFVIDTHIEDLAVREAIAMNVPVVGIVDTNADPDPIDYVIPANDDASGSIKLILGYIVDAWIEGKKKLANGEERMAKSSELKKDKSSESEGNKANGKGQMANGNKQQPEQKKQNGANSEGQRAEGKKTTEEKVPKEKKAGKKTTSEKAKSI